MKIHLKLSDSGSGVNLTDFSGWLKNWNVFFNKFKQANKWPRKVRLLVEINPLPNKDKGMEVVLSTNSELHPIEAYSGTVLRMLAANGMIRRVRVGFRVYGGPVVLLGRAIPWASAGTDCFNFDHQGYN